MSIRIVIAVRPPGIARLEGEQEKEAYRAYAGTTPKRVVGSAIHCVGGDGPGIMTAIGGWQDFMGLCDLGGRQVTALVFGPHRTVGSTRWR